jgi:hypothetical protein
MLDRIQLRSVAMGGLAASMLTLVPELAFPQATPIVFLPGHKCGPSDCKTENFVTRALCQ